MISGLPGTGKSSLAGPLAQRIGAATMSRDQAMREIEGPLAVLDRAIAGLFGVRLRRLQERANQRLESAVTDQLSSGLSVVVEVVADRDIRGRLGALAARHAARLCPIEVVCSDAGEHLRRLGSRGRNWKKIAERTARSYLAAPGTLVLDSCLPPAELVELALDSVQRGRANA
jgi:predicted kinase